jgi:hypothetical protein
LFIHTKENGNESEKSRIEVKKTTKIPSQTQMPANNDGVDGGSLLLAGN